MKTFLVIGFIALCTVNCFASHNEPVETNRTGPVLFPGQTGNSPPRGTGNPKYNVMAPRGRPVIPISYYTDPNVESYPRNGPNSTGPVLFPGSEAPRKTERPVYRGVYSPFTLNQQLKSNTTKTDTSSNKKANSFDSDEYVRSIARSISKNNASDKCGSSLDESNSKSNEAISSDESNLSKAESDSKSIVSDDKSISGKSITQSKI